MWVLLCFLCSALLAAFGMVRAKNGSDYLLFLNVLNAQIIILLLLSDFFLNQLQWIDLILVWLLMSLLFNVVYLYLKTKNNEG